MSAKVVNPELGARLKQARIVAKLTQPALGEAVDMRQSAIAEIEAGRVKRPKKLREIARAVGRSEEWLLGETQSNIADQHRQKPGITEIPLRGEVAAGRWLEVDGEEAGTYDPETVPVAPTPGIAAEHQYALTVRGTSLNKLARDGDVLICTDIIKSGARIDGGDLVIVERIKYQRSMREVTAKRVREIDGGFELWPESDDPKHQDPIRIDNGTHDDEEISVNAKVLWIMRKP